MGSFKSPMSRREFLKGITLTGAGLMLSTLLPGCSRGTVKEGATAAKKAIKIKLATNITDQMLKYIDIGVYKFKELIEKKSNGEILVDVYAGEQLGSQQVTAEKTQAGSLEISTISTQNFAQFVPQYNLLDLPYLFPSVEKFIELSQSEVFDKALHKPAESKGFKALWYAPTGFRVLGISKKVAKPVRRPDDLKGLKIRVTASVPEQKFYEVCGANPVPIAWAETYTALQQGVADGLNVGLPPIVGFRMHEQLKYLTEVNFMFNIDFIIANLKWFNSLPKDVQELIMQVCKETADWQWKNQQTLISNCYNELSKWNVEVIKLSADELNAFKEKTAHHLPIWDEMKKQWGAESYEIIAKAVSG